MVLLYSYPTAASILQDTLDFVRSAFMLSGTLVNLGAEAFIPQINNAGLGFGLGVAGLVMLIYGLLKK